MPPQITCPHCGNTINLENRKEVDYDKILSALNASPRTFSELLTMTDLPRKTLSIRLKTLCTSGTIVKDGGYRLGASIAPDYFKNSIQRKKGNGNGKMSGTILRMGKNIQWIPIALIFCLFAVTFCSAMIILSPPPAGPGIPKVNPRPVVVTPAQPQAKVMQFKILPDPRLTGAGWETQWIVNKPLTFDASDFNEANGYEAKYQWDFGDGNSPAADTVVSHAYQEAGDYFVKLTVKDIYDMTHTITQQVTILSMPTTTIYVSEYQVNDIITLNVMVSDVDDLWGWQTGMTFNPLVLQCIPTSAPDNAPGGGTTAFIEGGFLKSGGNTMWFAGALDNNAGVISFHGCNLLDPATPVFGSGILATVTFKVIGDGSLNIHLTDVILMTKAGLEIPVFVAT